MMELAGRICSDAELLCFDEMVVADVADAMILRRLFNALYKVGICCVFTSNRHPDDLYKNGLNRESFLPFVRMLKDRCFVHDINSDTDYRLTGRRAEVYFDGSLAGSEERFDRLFNDITQGRPTKERIMRVFGRDVVAPRTVGGVARFHFLEICGSEAAKSAADYGVIAQVFHTVFLEGVPRLGGPDSDERRRFMTLIDELYQAKCKVVLLGETPERISLPGTDLMGGSAVGGEETLYAGKLIDADEGAFQLQRTVSRLFEMRSQEYLESAHAGTGELSALEGAEPE
jgi:predicted ATPase